MSTDGYEDLTQTGSAAATSSSAGVPFWGTSPEAYDTVVLAGMRFPGICRISGTGFKQRVDTQKAAGVHGSSGKQHGRETCGIDIHITIFTEEHLRSLEKIINAVKPRSGDGKPKPAARPKLLTDSLTKDNQQGFGGLTFADSADTRSGTTLGQVGESIRSRKPKPSTAKVTSPVFEVYHPMLALYRIHRVQVVEASIPEYKEKQDMFEVRLKCLEFGRKDASVAAPTGAEWDIEKLGPGSVGRKIGLAGPPPSKTNAGPG